jgi:hypothetical protein
MDQRLDHLVDRLAAAPTDRSLDHFEAELARGVAARRAGQSTAAAMAPVRAASIALTLAIGLAAGAVTAAAIAKPRPQGLFAVSAELAPSALLDGGR